MAVSRKTGKQVILVFIECPTRRDASRIGRKLVDSRLAACANVLGPVRSYYRWSGLPRNATEYLLLVKATQRGYPRLVKAVKAIHPYVLPAITGVKLHMPYPGFANWILGECSP